MGKDIKTSKEFIRKNILPIVLFVISVFCVLLFYYFRFHKINVETYEKNVQEVATEYVLQFENEFVSLNDQVKLYGNLYCEGKLTQQEMMKYISDMDGVVRVSSTDISGIGTDLEGRVADYSANPYNFAKKTKIISVNHLSNNNVFMVCEIKPGEEFIVVEYDSKSLDHFVNRYKFGNKAWIVFTDTKGNIVYSFDLKKINSIKPGESIYDALGTSKISEKGSRTFEVDGRETSVSFTTGDMTKWKVYIGVESQYVDSQIRTSEIAVRNMCLWLLLFVFVFIGAIGIGVFVERMESKEKSEGLVQLAETDQLTGLYNKVTTEKKIKEYMENYPDTQSLLFVLDIDNFKKINDTMGHAFGDEVLRNIGQGLKMQFRSSDIIGRAGGDEFIILLKDLRDDECLIREAKKLENYFRNLQVGGYVKYAATASIGCAVFPREGTSFEELYKSADQALYNAKRRGKNQLAFYKDPEGLDKVYK